MTEVRESSEAGNCRYLNQPCYDKTPKHEKNLCNHHRLGPVAISLTSIYPHVLQEELSDSDLATQVQEVGADSCERTNKFPA